MYERVLATTPAQHVILCGDSAGGNLALTQALHYRDRHLPLPGRVMLFSPWLDLTLTHPDVASIEPQDPMLARPGPREAATWWAGGDPLSLPLLSPLHADLRGLPPVDVFQGTLDILWPDTQRFAEQVAAAGGHVHLHTYPGAFHVFPATTYTPEAQDVFRTIRQLLNARPAATEGSGLVKLVSLPPVRLIVYLQNAPSRGAAGPRRRGVRADMSRWACSWPS